MTVLLWIAAIALIVIGVAGTVLPALPGAILVFSGIALAAWIGLLLGTVAKVAIVLTMIGIFVFALLV